MTVIVPRRGAARADDLKPFTILAIAGAMSGIAPANIWEGSFVLEKRELSQS
jgi:hypothetical protein